MPERDGYIPGVPCWVDASEPDPEAALDFYAGLFNWDFEDATPPDAGRKYFVARAEATGWSLFDSSGDVRSGDVAALGSMPEAAPQTAVWNTYFWVESADETASTVRDAGGSVVMEPFDFMDASRVAVFTDPEGATFSVWEAKKHKGARLVNDPGSLNFNGLNTRDVEGARSFYGSVFGWQTLTRSPGPRCGRCPATATTSSATTRTSASKWRRRGPRSGSRTSSRHSIPSRRTSLTRRHIGA
jgi:predicted enzyme related to lactoylglutathione lyase